MSDEIPIPVGTRVKIRTSPGHYDHLRVAKVYDGPYVAVRFRSGRVAYFAPDQLESLAPPKERQDG